MLAIVGSPLFPGENEQDQIACIMEVLGLPPASVMRKIRRQHHFFTAGGVPRYLVERAEQIEHQVLWRKYLKYAPKCDNAKKYFSDFIVQIAQLCIIYVSNIFLGSGLEYSLYWDFQSRFRSKACLILRLIQQLHAFFESHEAHIKLQNHMLRKFDFCFSLLMNVSDFNHS